MEFETIIQNGTVIDGLGSPAKRADVGIAGDSIRAVGDLCGCDSVVRVEAQDKIVTPGFLDLLAHSYFTLLSEPSGPSKLLQGVTLEVEGENLGAAPAMGPARAWLQKSGLDALGLELDWETCEEYQSRLIRRGLGLNVALTIPGGLLRACVTELHDARPLSPKQLDGILRLLTDCLQWGAVGLTCVLPEWPACYYRETELLELCRIVAQHNAIAAFHLRDEAGNLLDALDEVISLAQRTGVRTEVVHFKVLGPANWHLLPRALDRIELARREGLEISANIYPYGTASLALQEMTPSGAQLDPKTLRIRLNDPVFRKQVEYELAQPNSLLCWDRIRPMSDVVGENSLLSLAEIASLRNQRPSDLAVELLRDSDEWVHCQCDLSDMDNICRTFARDWVSIGSDGSARSPQNPALRVGPVHPRDYGTFPKVLRYLVRERRVVGFVEAIRRMTSQSADRIGLRDRGRVSPGAKADLLVFSADEFRDEATYENPHLLASGMDYVFVNGHAVVVGGELTGKRSGMVVRR